MNYPSFFNSKNSLILFGLQEEFNFLHKLYLNKRLPRVLMLTGNKGCGKSTLINHFFFSIFDSSSYDYNNYSLLKNSIFLKQYQNDIFSNVIYLKYCQIIIKRRPLIIVFYFLCIFILFGFFILIN